MAPTPWEPGRTGPVPRRRDDTDVEADGLRDPPARAPRALVRDDADGPRARRAVARPPSDGLEAREGALEGGARDLAPRPERRLRARPPRGPDLGRRDRRGARGAHRAHRVRPPRRRRLRD